MRAGSALSNPRSSSCSAPINSRSLDTDEELPALFPLAELGNGPCWLQRRVMFRKSDEQLLIRNGGAAMRPGDMASLPAKNLLNKRPRIPQGGLRGIRVEQPGDRTRVDRGLPQGREPQSLQEAGGDNKPDRLNMVQPFEVGVAIKVCGHGDHPDTGQ